MRYASIAILVAFLVALVATQAIYVHVGDNPAQVPESAESNSGLLATEVESLENEERQESTQDGDEHFRSDSNSRRIAAHLAAYYESSAPTRARRSSLGRLRTRAP